MRQQAQANQKKAASEAAKSQQVAQFMKDMLKGVGPSVALGRDTTMLREILDKTAERIGKDLTNRPEVELALRDTLAGTYRQLGLYRQVEEMARKGLLLARSLGEEKVDVAIMLTTLAEALMQLGNMDEAEKFTREAVTLQRKLLPAERPGSDVRASMCNSLNLLAQILAKRGKLAEAETAAREALVLGRNRFGNESLAAANSLMTLANVLKRQQKLAEAETMQREALAMERKLLGKQHPIIATSLNGLATALRAQGKLPEAETMLREALAMRRELLGNEHPDVANLLGNLANVLREQGRLAEAETMYREALAMRRRLLGNEHPLVVESLGSLADVLSDQGKLAEAETMLRETLALVRTASAKDPAGEISSLGQVLHHFAEVLRRRNELTEARSLAEEAAALYRRHPDWPSTERQHAFAVLGDVLTDLGDLIGAEALFRERLQSLRTQLASDDPGLAGLIAQLTCILRGEKKFAEAEPFARECLTIREKKLPDDWLTFNGRSILGDSLLGQKKYAEAEPLLLSGYEGMKQREDKIPAGAKRFVKEILQRLVQLYEATGQTEKATEWKAKLPEYDTTEKEKKASVPRP
jgi:tetratricopeptide (TPR) repeat protein